MNTPMPKEYCKKCGSSICQNEECVMEIYIQQIRKIILDEHKRHILYIGNEILEDNMTAKEFWQKLQRLCF